MLVARHTSQWHLTSGEVPSLVRIELDVESLLLGRGRDTQRRSLVAHLRREQESVSTLMDTLSNRRVLNLTYEDDIATSPEVGYRRICSFAGIADHPVTVRFKRTNPFSLKEVLTNYAEVERALRGTEFEWMLLS